MKEGRRIIPLVDLKAQLEGFSREMEEAIMRVVHNAYFIGGSEVEAFEDAFARFCGTRYCVSVASGTDALRLALQACGIGGGDEVITVPNTFIATTEAISLLGARPLFVDIDRDTYTINSQKVEELLATHTGEHTSIKAIMPVHLYGQPAAMEPLLNLAQRYDLKVIEDACQAHGALYYDQGTGGREQGVGKSGGKRVGSIGDVGCFSFYPGKNLGAYGDGGAVVTNDEKIAERVIMLRDHGRLGKKYEHEIEGCNSRLDALQAAILNVKLKHLEGWNEQRRRNARLYDELLLSVPGIRTPTVAPWGTHVYHLYVVRVKAREVMQQRLYQEGIATGIHYPIPLHLQKAYRYLGYRRGDFPVTEELSEEIISLPMYPELTQDDIVMIVEKIKDFVTLVGT